jgi:hypothetical protein
MAARTVDVEASGDACGLVGGITELIRPGSPVARTPAGRGSEVGLCAAATVVVGAADVESRDLDAAIAGA